MGPGTITLIALLNIVVDNMVYLNRLLFVSINQALSSLTTLIWILKVGITTNGFFLYELFSVILVKLKQEKLKELEHARSNQ